jgi:hypothetical protein
MGSDRVPTGDVAAELPELSGRLRPPEPQAMPQTLAGRLVPLADRLRGLKARFGIRPYRVFLVHAVWTGGKRGIGHQQLTSRFEIIPPPRVRDLSGVNRRLRAAGLTEEGDVTIDEISAKYAEDDLMGRTPDLQNPELRRTLRQDVEFWWEVHEARAVGVPTVIRRYSPPTSVPTLSRDNMQWKVTLTKQGEDRGRNGGTDRNEP